MCVCVCVCVCEEQFNPSLFILKEDSSKNVQKSSVLLVCHCQFMSWCVILHPNVWKLRYKLMYKVKDITLNNLLQSPFI